MSVELASMAVVMPEVIGHPNKVAFRGVLTFVDVPSQRAPSGAKGHLVLLTRTAAEAALPSLLGMALDYAPTLDRHDVRRTVGVITRAELVGRKLELGGYLFARDFPEIVEEIAKSEKTESEAVHPARSETFTTPMQSGARSWNERGWRPMSKWRSCLATGGRLSSLTSSISGIPTSLRSLRKELHSAWRSEVGVGNGLGMSYEVADVQLADTRARVWTLTKVTFTGAAILRRSKAAYEDTWIELA